MLTDTKIKVHPELAGLHKSASCCRTNDRCCCDGAPRLRHNVCGNFASCGPGVACGTPCRHCLAWEGYGGDETVQAILNNSSPKTTQAG